MPIFLESSADLTAAHIGQKNFIVRSGLAYDVACSKCNFKGRRGGWVMDCPETSHHTCEGGTQRMLRPMDDKLKATNFKPSEAKLLQTLHDCSLIYTDARVREVQ